MSSSGPSPFAPGGPGGRGDQRPGYGPAPAPGQHAPQLPPAPHWPQPARRRTATLVVEIIGIALGLVGAVWLLAVILGQGGGVGATVLAGFLALLPLVGVLAAVAWVDRWEPEPRWLLLAALLWGVGVSTAVSLILNEAFAFYVMGATGSSLAASVLGTVVGAPLVEETAKGLGVLLIFLLRRRYFDGPVDGIVYAAVVAAGFAFTENILYFVQYSDVLTEVFVARAVQSPFAHVTFTAVIGIALGFASRSANRHSWLWLFPVGWLGAMMLHAVWNGSAALALYDVLYWLFQVPLFAAGIVLVVWLRNDEKATIGHRLSEYAAAGWFAPYEIQMLTSMSGRRAARRWAASRGAGAGAAMKDFQRAATTLAFTRQRALSGRYDLRTHVDERELLDAVVRARAGYLAAA
ncbi:PrsW family intramembrane metalloprotease [Georgenia daeguensis]|uniref:PrsW family intramembrane metalloprotease n=1 Tax=Georgenia daeguensis TaxID=908355 RepID=A0ABP8EQ37_9MICO